MNFWPIFQLIQALIPLSGSSLFQLLQALRNSSFILAFNSIFIMHQKFQLIPAFTIPAFPSSKKFRLILANPVRIYRQMQAFSVLFWNFYNEPENSSFFPILAFYSSFFPIPAFYSSFCNSSFSKCQLILSEFTAWTFQNFPGLSWNIPGSNSRIF